MKYIFCLIILFYISCNSKKEKNNLSLNNLPINKTIDLPLATQDIEKNSCWTGTLNSKIPIFLHYQTTDNLIIGEITYLNTKAKKPINIIGTFENGNYRILEFEKNGNITGVISGTPTNKHFKGSWNSPKTQKKLSLELTKSDSIIHSKQIETKLKNMYGEYYYQYSESGYQGGFTLTKINNQNASFNVFSVTGAPSRNIADIIPDTIQVNTTEFIYNIPESDDCEFKVQFYKDIFICKLYKRIL